MAADVNIYEKLSRLRESVKKETWSSFYDLMALVHKRAKYYRILPLYCHYDNVATLSMVDMDNITMCIKFQIPVESVGMKNVKKELYYMALEITETGETISPKQYIELTEKMKEVEVTEAEVLERYKLKSLAEMPVEIYQRCKTALAKSKK